MKAEYHIWDFRHGKADEREHEADPRGGFRQFPTALRKQAGQRTKQQRFLNCKAAQTGLLWKHRRTKEHQLKVADSASAMEGVANSSIGQVQSIQGAIKRHKELVSMMEDAFAQVSGISEKLLEISRSEV